MVLGWAAHRRAPWLLGLLSFAESSFFPIPPDVMLAPMALARPQKAWLLATITTLTSVAGGLFGYLLGYFALELVLPLLERLGYMEHYHLARAWFERRGFWIVLIAGFSPIPYKLFTIAAGAAALNPLLFVIASLIGRGGRFYLVAGLLAWGGPRLEPWLRTYIERIGWATVALLAVGIAIAGVR
ncbi:MAG: DedA family protein [Xanthomonadaceae bacterium]|nr:DedA family protein [Xanthomonadaceae bacterium]